MLPVEYVFIIVDLSGTGVQNVQAGQKICLAVKNDGPLACQGNCKALLERVHMCFAGCNCRPYGNRTGDQINRILLAGGWQSG